MNESVHATLTSALVAGSAVLDARAADARWSLATDDTALRVAVTENRISIVSLKRAGDAWEWLPAPSEVPMPGRDSVKVAGKAMTPTWEYRDASELRTNGHLLILRFTNAEPALELKSYWQALPGCGPVEDWMTIENQTGGAVALSPAVAAGALRFKADRPVTFHRAEKTAAGTGRVFIDAVTANARLSTGSGILPLAIFDAGSEHGLYLGFEWELGGFQVAAGADPLSVAVSVNPLTEEILLAPRECLWIPAVYYGVYRGDTDDGANRFKRWFWNHKITRSLHDNPGEPWVEVCMQDIGGKGSTSITGLTPQSVYDRLAATGAECAKMDFWDGTGQCWYTDRDWQFKPAVWPNGFDFATKAHKAGMKASLYMGGTYLDGDLNTVEARDRQLAALLMRYDEGWFDMWRTDRYTAPHDPMPSTYRGVANFLYIQDHLIANRPGYRYENCCNGGKFKGFAICRRMTFSTMNDIDQDPLKTRTTYYANSFAINTVQLKSDLGPAHTPYQLRTHMLGAILSWAADNPVYRQHIALYKSRQRPILRGANVYHILPMPDGKNWDGLQFYNPDLDRGSVFLFKPSETAPETQVVRLRGLVRDRNYDVAFQDATDRSCTMTGAKLMDEGLSVTLTGREASEIIWLNCFEWSAHPSQLSFSVVDPADKAAPQQVALTYRRGPGPDKAFSVAAADPWVKVEPGTGAGHGQTFAVSVDSGDLPSAIHRSKVLVSRQDIPDKLEIPVRLRIGIPVPKVVTIHPPVGRCAMNGEQRFTASVLDQFGEPHEGRVLWSVSGGGKIGNDGTFRGEGPAGGFAVTAVIEGHPSATATAGLRVLSTDLARWKLDEKSGTVAADAWGDFPGTLVGGPVWEAGQRGGALRFNGKGQYVDTRWSLDGLQFPCTFAFWVNPADTQCEYADIFGNHAGSTHGVVMQQNGTEVNNYSFGYGSAPAPGGAGPVQLTADEWQHVAVVCDGKEVVIYLDAREAARGAGKNPLTPNPNLGFRLGSGYAQGRFFNGALDDFRVYARALSVEELAKLMTAQDGQ
jgi:hypothetical protein